MVQFKRDLPLPADGEPDNTYWAIGGTAWEAEFMRSSYRDYRPRPFTGDEYVDCKNRQERGLLYFPKYTVKELRAFIKERGIDLPKGCVRKASLVETLKDADEERKFTKFFELPAELRNNIYAKYFEDLGDLPQLPHQPPLLLASSAVRTEALPLYYQHATFTLGFVTNCRTLDLVRGRRMKPLRTSVHKDTQALLKRISDQDFVTVRRLSVQLWKPELDYGDSITSFVSWTTDLSGPTGSAITQEHNKYWSTPWDPIRESVKEALERTLSEIRGRSGAQKITKADVYALMSVIHHAML